VSDEMLVTLREGLESSADQGWKRYEWRLLALLRRRRLVRFGTQVPTFTGYLECESLTEAV
jgi:hypothetical protein